VEKGSHSRHSSQTQPERRSKLRSGSSTMGGAKRGHEEDADIEESPIIFTVWFPHKAIFPLLCDRGSEWMNPVGGDNNIYLFPVLSLLFKRLMPKKQLKDPAKPCPHQLPNAT
jgi:hypothetical protein